MRRQQCLTKEMSEKCVGWNKFDTNPSLISLPYVPKKLEQFDLWFHLQAPEFFGLIGKMKLSEYICFIFVFFVFTLEPFDIRMVCRTDFG